MPEYIYLPIVLLLSLLQSHSHLSGDNTCSDVLDCFLCQPFGQCSSWLHANTHSARLISGLSNTTAWDAGVSQLTRLCSASPRLLYQARKHLVPSRFLVHKVSQSLLAMRHVIQICRDNLWRHSPLNPSALAKELEARSKEVTTKVKVITKQALNGTPTAVALLVVFPILIGIMMTWVAPLFVVRCFFSS